MRYLKYSTVFITFLFSNWNVYPDVIDGISFSSIYRKDLTSRYKVKSKRGYKENDYTYYYESKNLCLLLTITQ